MTNDEHMSRLDWIELGADEEALFLSEEIYDGAIIGVCDGRICYCVDRIIEALMEADGMTYEEAMDYFEFNISGVYMGPMTPLFIAMPFV